MVLPLTGPSRRSASRPYRVGIVEAYKALAVTVVQGERVRDTLRMFGTGRNSVHSKLDPVIARRVDNEDLAVEIEEVIEGPVGLLPAHPCPLSYADNAVNVKECAAQATGRPALMCGCPGFSVCATGASREPGALVGGGGRGQR